jgi:hypothetical protein
MSIENTNNTNNTTQSTDCLQLTNGQAQAINDLKSLFREDEENKWQTNQCKQSESMYNNPSYHERMDISYISQRLARIQRKFDEPSVIKKSKRIQDVNIIMKKTNKSFDLCLEAYLLTNDVDFAIRILS